MYNSCMKISNIHKLYISNFLAGLVFWFGIEKLFMTSIGIDAIGIGVATAVLTIVLLVLDIPSGIIADKWSRKGLLVISALALGVASVICGLSQGLPMYIIGEIFYGIFVVATSGTYQAITYDTLKEEGRASIYSKVIGIAYALFLIGAGVGDIAGGFLAGAYDYRLPFLLSAVTCTLNGLVLISLREPKFHKEIEDSHVLKQLNSALSSIVKVYLVKALAIVLTMLAVIELFKLEFGQLYMLRYIDEPAILGLLWALFAFAMALGSFFAHKFHARLSILIMFSTLPLVLMSFIDSSFSLVLFMVQATAAAALLNQVETRVQEHTPSSVRASVLSVLSSIGRLITIPAGLALGYVFKEYDEMWAVRIVAIVAVGALAYWLYVSIKVRNVDVSLNI